MGSSNHEAHRSAVPHRQRHRPLLRRHLRSSGGTRFEVGRSGLRSRLRRQPSALVASPPPSLLVEPSPPSLPLSSLRLSPPDANLVQCLAHCTFFCSEIASRARKGNLDAQARRVVGKLNGGAVQLRDGGNEAETQPAARCRAL